MELFIGVDQSINSTGVTIELYENDKLLDKHFYIVTGKRKLTSREAKASSTYSNFEYVHYYKHDVKDARNNHEAEIFKTKNIINISKAIISLMSFFIRKYAEVKYVYICIEGISYQSSNTSSLADLSGLNYILRYDFMRYFSALPGVYICFEDYAVIVATPGEIKKFASGNGQAKKDTMVSLFESIHPNLYLIPKIDDIADSYWMAEYARHIFLEKNKEK